MNNDTKFAELMAELGLDGDIPDTTSIDVPYDDWDDDLDDDFKQ